MECHGNLVIFAMPPIFNLKPLNSQNKIPLLALLLVNGYYVELSKTKPTFCQCLHIQTPKKNMLSMLVFDIMNIFKSTSETKFLCLHSFFVNAYYMFIGPKKNCTARALLF